MVINKFNSIAPNGYNLSTGGIGYGNLGRKVKIGGKKFKTLKDAAKGATLGALTAGFGGAVQKAAIKKGVTTRTPS